MTKLSPKRRAYILIVVLGLTAVVTSLGWAFIDAHSTIMPEAVNRLEATRAQYLAESGIDVGTHFLMHPPTTVAPGHYWTGASGIAVDDTADYVDVVVVQDTTDPTLFTITAVGVAHDYDGSIRGKHTITAEVIRPPDGKWHIPYALVSNDHMHPEPTVAMFGDVHANGQLFSEGWCQDDVTATAEIWWVGGGPPASITEYEPHYTTPAANPAFYQTYSINGNDYAAYSSWPYDDIYHYEAEALNAQDWSATNPGRIIYIDGDFKLEDNVHLIGTLAVNGHLEIKGPGVEITAVPGYPALVVKDHIEFRHDWDSLVVTGSVICGKDIRDHDEHFVSLEVTGACIVGEHPGIDEKDNDDTFLFFWDEGRSVFWNLEVPYEPQPITILTWREN